MCMDYCQLLKNEGTILMREPRYRPIIPQQKIGVKLIKGKMVL